MKIGDRVITFDDVNVEETVTGVIAAYKEPFYFVKVDNRIMSTAVARLKEDMERLETPLEKLAKRLNSHDENR